MTTWDELMEEITNRMKEAVPVVRCKDCLWYRGKEKDGLGLCAENGKYWAEDDFCSYGDRRKDNEHTD